MFDPFICRLQQIKEGRYSALDILITPKEYEEGELESTWKELDGKQKIK